MSLNNELAKIEYSAIEWQHAICKIAIVFIVKVDVNRLVLKTVHHS